MITTSKILRVVASIGFTLFSVAITYAQTPAENAKADKVSNYIAVIAKKMAVHNEGIKSVSMNWPENPEVKYVATLNDPKRMGALFNLIRQQRTYEETYFPNSKTNQGEMTMSLINRLLSFSKYQSLLGKSDYDLVVKDYLDGEIADIKMVFGGKIPVGLYFQGSKGREEKYYMLSLQDKEITKEALTFGTTKDAKLENLAAKTFMVSIFESCTQNMDLCSNLSGK